MRFIVKSKGFEDVVRSPSARQALIDHVANTYGGDYIISACAPEYDDGETHFVVRPNELGAVVFRHEGGRWHRYADAVTQMPEQQNLL